MPVEIDPELHKAACILARRFTAMVACILRDEERGDCEREGYRIAREVLDELAAFKERR